MKSILGFMIAALVFSVSHSAFACAPAEAQVIAKVSALKKSGKDCLVKITDVTHYSESGICPLNSADAVAGPILIPNCSSLKVGDTLSGYLSMSEDGTIKLD